MAEASEWTIRTTLAWIEGYLAKKGDPHSRLSAQWLVSDVLSLSRIQLYTDYERPLTMDERTHLRQHVARRAQGEPLQYITGHVGFRHMTVKVKKGVLIPRPETEVLVSEVLHELPKPSSDPAEKTLLVADLCTGTGCIACSIALEHPDAKVIATDISSEAVALAKENIQAYDLGARVSVLECDLGARIDEDLMGTFDAVVANPPYVPTEVLQDIPDEVKGYEPHLALDGGADGLDIYRRIITWSLAALTPTGFLAVELHETTLDAAADIAREAGFAATRIVRDLTERPRVLIAYKQTKEEN